MLADINQSVQDNAGYVYVTDESLNPSTGYLYDQLPSYWDQEVAAIAGTAAPEPGTASLLVLGGLLMLLSVKLPFVPRCFSFARAYSPNRH